MTAAQRDGSTDRKLKILHVLRAPLGGLFRHVIDLTHEQIARGHAVGLVTEFDDRRRQGGDDLGRA